MASTDLQPSPDRSDSALALEVALRDESARLHGAAARILGNLDGAEEAVQEAGLRALEAWPTSGIPRNPAAWLMTTTRRIAIDVVRHRSMEKENLAPIAHHVAAVRASPHPDPSTMDDSAVPDDELRLLFMCCHPALPPEGQTALTLRLVAGLTVPAIARAYLLPESTISQRIVRAKRLLRDYGAMPREPVSADIPARLPAVLEVIYLLFTEGYASTDATALVREDLCENARRLGGGLADLLPGEPEVLGLLALMDFQASRAKARVDGAGEPVLLEDQDRTLWDRECIARGSSLVRRGEAMGRPGPYLVQAAIAACHAESPSFPETDWHTVVGLYRVLDRLAPSPLVQLNAAVAVGFADGPEHGLALLEPLRSDPRLAGYHRLPAARAGLLRRAGRRAEAVAAFIEAADLAPPGPERRWLERQRSLDIAETK
jgi:RNA polymerase sigma factor (sigma-70 family)